MIILTIVIIILLIVIIHIEINKSVFEKELSKISSILDDVIDENYNRVILVNGKDTLSNICYKINKIIKKCRKEIEDIQQEKNAGNQIMTSLAHDLRTPLSVIMGYLDAVQKGIVSQEEKESYIEIARQKTYDMKDYLEQLFEWLKLNSNEEKLELVSNDLSDLTRNILMAWVPLLESKGIMYDFEIPERAICLKIDASAYKRILNNLLQNMVTHSKANQMCVSILSEEKFIEIIIKDNGIGIDKKELPYIFERLYKCDKSRNVKGNGLGLSIVHKLVTMMDGRIYVNSEKNIFTEFKIYFKYK